MSLQLYRTLWGAEGDYATIAGAAAAEGFDGLEGQVPDDPQRRAELSQVLADYGLAFACRNHHRRQLCTEPSRHRRCAPAVAEKLSGAGRRTQAAFRHLHRRLRRLAVLRFATLLSRSDGHGRRCRHQHLF